MKTLAQLLAAAASQGMARLDAQLLLLHALGRPQHDRAWLLAHDMDAAPATAAEAFMGLCARRGAGEPLAYLVGEKEFHGLRLHVDPRVLVPRPDTETLVEWALELLGCAALAPACTTPPPGGAPSARLAASAAHPGFPRVIDLGTGSGAIALAIKKGCPDADVEAVDASAEALAVARANGEALGLQVEWRQASWLDGAAGPYDLIVSNPPYVAAGDPHLPALRHEPTAALVSGPDGLDDVRRIVAQAPGRLAIGGWLLLEHGWDQAEGVRELLVQAGLADVQSRRDLGGTARCTGGRRLELG